MDSKAFGKRQTGVYFQVKVENGLINGNILFSLQLMGSKLKNDQLIPIGKTQIFAYTLKMLTKKTSTKPSNDFI